MSERASEGACSQYLVVVYDCLSSQVVMSIMMQKQSRLKIFNTRSRAGKSNAYSSVNVNSNVPIMNGSIFYYILAHISNDSNKKRSHPPT